MLLRIISKVTNTLILENKKGGDIMEGQSTGATARATVPKDFNQSTNGAEPHTTFKESQHQTAHLSNVHAHT